MYLWQSDKWPIWQYDQERIRPLLKRAMDVHDALLSQVEEVPDGLSREAELDALIQSAIKTSSIEGEYLNVASVRSSVARHLGLSTQSTENRHRKEAAVVQLLTEAIENPGKSLTLKDVCRWQSLLFPEPPVIRPIRIGDLRRDELGPMQVVSENRGQVIVHFEAPPAEQLEAEVAQFLNFINQFDDQKHGLIRAAWVHLYFITLHPFDDGNGRLARALTDRALAQFDPRSARFYAMSAAIEANKADYYQILESVQNVATKEQAENSMDLSTWVVWFLKVWIEAVEQARFRIDRVLGKSLFWQQHAQTVLSARQIKVLNRLLDSAGEEFVNGLAARHYQSIAKVSKATATRDLTDLVSKGCLKTLPGGGRSVRYHIKNIGLN